VLLFFVSIDALWSDMLITHWRLAPSRVQIK